jgi:hypothetical protein
MLDYVGVDEARWDEKGAEAATKILYGTGNDGLNIFVSLPEREATYSLPSIGDV